MFERKSQINVWRYTKSEDRNPLFNTPFFSMKLVFKYPDMSLDSRFSRPNFMYVNIYGEIYRVPRNFQKKISNYQDRGWESTLEHFIRFQLNWSKNAR